MLVQLFASSAYITVCIECACVVRNSITSIDASMLKSMQQRFQTFCLIVSFLEFIYSYSLALDRLKPNNWRVMRRHSDALFLFTFTLILNSVLRFLKLLVFEFLFCTSETSLIIVCSSSKNCFSARCASAAGDYR